MFTYVIHVADFESERNLLLIYKPPPPPAFRPKIVYFYVIEIAESECDLGLHGKAISSNKNDKNHKNLKILNNHKNNSQKLSKLL